MHVNSVTAARQGVTASSGLELGLDKDAFLKLLVAQLRYQDPMSPMSNTEFIAQMAQFSALEQMYNLNNSFYVLQQQVQEAFMLQAVSLIGKEVTAELDEQTVSGTVEKVNWTAAGTILTVDGRQVPLSAVRVVSVPEPEAPPIEEQELAAPVPDTGAQETETEALDQEAGDSPDPD